MEMFLLFLIGSFISGIVFSGSSQKRMYIVAAVASLILAFIYFNFNSYI